MLLSILLQAIGGIGLTKLGAAIGAGIAVLGAGIGIGRIGGHRTRPRGACRRGPARRRRVGHGRHCTTTVGIQQRTYEYDHRGSFDRRCSPHRHCRLSFDIVPLNRCCLWDC